jgi:hypothetical protein
MACFSSWVAECWPDKLDLVVIDRKTPRRSHNRKTGQKALHLVSAFATNSRLVPGQGQSMKNRLESPPFQPSGSALILRALLSRLCYGVQRQHCPVDPRRQGRLSVSRQGQPTDCMPIPKAISKQRHPIRSRRSGKDHGRFEVRTYTVSHVVVCPTAQLSGRTPPYATGHHRHGRKPHRR